MRYAICGITVETIDDAVERGWTPYFYDGETEHEPACPACSEALLQIDEHGEWEVKQEFGGKMKYFDDGREKSGDGDLLIGIAVSENGPGKLN
jgi:hypothetical protein